MNLLKALSKVPIIGIFFSWLLQVLINYHSKRLAGHFSEYLQPVFAENKTLRDQCFSIRHSVYCEELKFEDVKEDKRELDEVDCHSYHCLIKHRASERFAGTVRVVYSTNDSQQLPLEKYCLDSIDDEELKPTNFPREKICEISRLAVPEEFRRRKTDKFKGAATGAINETTYSEQELRCFPFIALGLYLSAASVVINKNIEHCFVMMEPRLARSLKRVGIEFKQIGPVVDYHGKRAPYYINPDMLLKSLTPGFMKMFNNIKSELSEQSVKSVSDFFGILQANKQSNTEYGNL